MNHSEPMKSIYVHNLLTNPWNWVKAGFSTVLLSMLLAAVVPVSYQMIEENYMPVSHWFEYSDISPVKSEFALGERIEFVSVAVIHKETNVNWSDTLMCDTGDGGGMRHFSTQQVSRISVPARRSIPKLWVYGKATPQVPATCFLESAIEADLRFTSKVQSLRGSEFTIK